MSTRNYSIELQYYLSYNPVRIAFVYKTKLLIPYWDIRKSKLRKQHQMQRRRQLHLEIWRDISFHHLGEKYENSTQYVSIHPVQITLKDTRGQEMWWCFLHSVEMKMQNNTMVEEMLQQHIKTLDLSLYRILQRPGPKWTQPNLQYQTQNHTMKKKNVYKVSR